MISLNDYKTWEKMTHCFVDKYFQLDETQKTTHKHSGLQVKKREESSDACGMFNESILKCHKHCFNEHI